MQVPIMAKVAMLFFSLRKEQLKFTDERVKLINELVQGIRVIKMCAWETAMQKRIDAVRTHARRTRAASHDKELDKELCRHPSLIASLIAPDRA
jgi:hypothetical protein